jgi:protein-tyrosine-phosphatase
MAEALARKYGSDVLRVASAGLMPMPSAHGTTRDILLEVNVNAGEHVPRRLTDLDLSRFDLIVNISGRDLSLLSTTPIENWEIEDPFGGTDEEYRRARDEIEMLVMRLILRARLGQIMPLRSDGIRR